MCRIYFIVLWVSLVVVSDRFEFGYGSNGTANFTVANTTEFVDWNVTDFELNVTAVYENETLINDTTTEEIVTTTAVPVVTPFEETHLEFCICDVTSVFCDVNCCCDSDCSAADRTAFTDCVVAGKQESFDARYCFKEIPTFRNNSPYKMIQTSNDLFCIYKDNFPQRFAYKDLTVITDAVDFGNILEEHADDLWSSTRIRRDDDEFLVETLKVGSPVYVKYSDGNIGYLVLPRSFTSGHCNTKNPMSYMTDQTFSCYQHLRNHNKKNQSDCTTNRWLNGNFYYEHFKVAKSSASFNFKNVTNSTETDFLDVTPQLCVGTAEEANISCNFANVPDPYYENGTCFNAVSKAFYVIEHNGTEGLLNIEIHLTLENFEATTNWMQEHGVSFRWPSENRTVDKPLLRSGNPGYLIGAPVIAGRLVTREMEGKRTAVELNPDPRSWLTVMMPSASGSGQCLWKNGSMGSGFNRVPIGFGYDLRTGCLVVVSLNNLTNMCQVIQSVALDALHGWDPPNVVAAYGNPKVENPGEWVPILRENQPSVLRSNYEDFSCTNIVRELNIHILYANIGSMNNPQPKIIGVRFRYGNADLLKLRCTGHYCLSGSEELTQSFTVTSTVSFVDLSEMAVPMFAEPPTVDIHLPYDFFYPFHVSDDAVNIKPQSILYILFILTTFLFK